MVALNYTQLHRGGVRCGQWPQQQQRFDNTIAKHFLYLFVILGTFLSHSSHAYPSASIAQNAHPSSDDDNGRISAVSKRAFDRLDASPFDFDALSKRFDDGLYLYHDSGRVKRAFDRLEDSGFFGLRRRRRAFDRLDHSGFLTGSKRSESDHLVADDAWVGDTPLVMFADDRQKRAFDRLDSSMSFGLSKRSERAPSRRVSIEELLEKYPATLGL